MADSWPLRVEGFLVVKATGEMRVTKRRSRLNMDEVAFPLAVTIPRTWGRVQATTITVSLPEPPEARVSVGEPQLDEPEPPTEPTDESTELRNG